MIQERPILFNGAMVRAILSGAKTQTRRVVKPQPLEESFLDAQGVYQPRFDEEGRLLVAMFKGVHLLACPFGQPGDRLWVRETWAEYIDFDTSPEGAQIVLGGDIVYRADGEDQKRHTSWRPSIHMRRDYCRLVLEVTDVRVERLQEISLPDLIAEGIACYPDVNPFHDFEELWARTGGDWAGNPWVWVVSFKVVTP